MRAAVALFALVSLAACHESFTLITPDLTGAKSVLWIVVGPDGRASGHALEREPLTSLAADEQSRIYLLRYERPLDELGLSPGDTPLIVDPNAASRRIPRPDSAYERLPGSLQLAPLDDAEAALEGLGLPIEDFNACLARNGCSAAREGAEKVCSVGACDRPPVMPPLPVRDGPCPDGWTPVGPTRVGACLPPVEVACPPGEAQWYGARVCTPIGPSCPAGDWATDVTGAPLLYVRPNAAGGDGSEAAPYTLSEAIVAASSGAVILLARGDYALGTGALTPRAGVSLVGACTASTRLLTTNTTQPAFRISSAGVTISRVTIDAPTTLELRAGGGLEVEDAALLGGASIASTPSLADDDGRSVVHVIGGQVTLRRVSMYGRTYTGVRVAPAGAVSLEEVVFDGPKESPFSEFMRGQSSDPISLRRVAIRGAHNALRSFDGNVIEGDEVTIEDFVHNSLDVKRDARITLTNVVIQAPALSYEGDAEETNIVREGGLIDVERVVMIVAGGVQRRSCFEVNPPGEMKVTRGYLSGCGAAFTANDMRVTGTPALTASDVWVELSHTGTYWKGGAVELRRMHFSQLKSQGICVAESSRFDAEDIVVEDVAALSVGRCFNDAAAGTCLGTAAEIVEPRLERFELRRCAFQALYEVGMNGIVRDGVIAESPVGATLGIGFDPYAHLVRVRFEDNDLDIVIPE